MDKLTYTVTEAAELLGIGWSAAYEAARSGEIPTIRIGKRILVPLPALKRLLEQDRGESGLRRKTQGGVCLESQQPPITKAGMPRYGMPALILFHTGITPAVVR